MSGSAVIEKPKVPPPDVWPPDDDGGGGGGGGDGGGDPSRGPHESGPPIRMARLAMYFVLAMVLMLFAGVVSSYMILRDASDVWPPPDFPELPGSVWLSTAAIALSSLTGAWALRAARLGNARFTTARLGLTLVLGLFFCVSQAVVWQELVAGGATPRSSNYSGKFYTLTGLHVAHVIGGIVYLAVCFARSWVGHRPRNLADSVSNCMLYWHFVGAIWYVLLALFV